MESTSCETTHLVSSPILVGTWRLFGGELICALFPKREKNMLCEVGEHWDSGLTCWSHRVKPLLLCEVSDRSALQHTEHTTGTNRFPNAFALAQGVPENRVAFDMAAERR